MKHCLAIACLLCLLASCSGTKNLERVNLDMPASFDKTGKTDSLSIADMEWYEFYGDSLLCDIIRHTLANNRDMLIAAARVEKAAALYGIDRAAMLPEVSLLASGDREETDYSGAGSKVDPEYSLKANITWEINLWGALSWAKKRGYANYMASVEDRRAMEMTLTAAVATAYFNLIALENELTIVRETLFTRSEALEQARIRFEGGLTSETVYQQARVEYSSTASLIPDLERKVNTARNALSMLMGEFPQADISHAARLYQGNLPQKVVTGFPSDLLQRRPDLRAAEQRLAAAMDGVGLAYANRFPSFRINATVGFENDELGQFFKSPYTYILGSLAGPVLDFGKRKKRYQAAIAEYDEARLSYEKSVIQAFTEVNNALVTFNKYQQTYELKVSLRDATWEYVKLAQLQYRGGSLNYLDVLDAQRRYFEAQIGVINALRDEYFALITLYKSLGGGWTPPTGAKD